MKQMSELVSERGVLTPTVPRDIGPRSQRQRIVTAMAASCAEKTFAAATIADIVGHASISRATFYKHFANKHECFAATAESFIDELQSAAAQTSAEEDSAVEVVRKAIAAVLERLTSKPAYANLLLVEAPNVDPQIVQNLRRIVMQSLDAQLGTQHVPGGADPSIAFGRAKVLIADYVAAGRVEQVPSLLPELVYITLLPYVGQEAALEQAGIER